ncbi:low molecular weight phosphatase family protein [Simiduia curdlanivorans]
MLKHYYYQVLDKIFNKYKRYKVVHHKPARIVFVCKGNICRSAFAEWLFKEKSNIPVCSIGLDTKTGGAANSRVAALSEKMGVSLEAHRTTSIRDYVYQPGDSFVCMEPYQAKLLSAIYSDSQILLLGAFATNKNVYIHDPYSASDSYASNCLVHLSECTLNLISHLDAAPRS